MTDILPTISESDALATLRGFFLTVVSCEVIRAQQNKVAMPKGEFIALTPVNFKALNTPVNTNTATQQTIERHYQFIVQVDCYGANALGRATTLSMLLRDGIATDYFSQSGFNCQTLYADDAQQLPIVTGEEQWLERWTFQSALQLNQQITTTIETADTLSIDLIDVDAQYPA